MNSSSELDEDDPLMTPAELRQCEHFGHFTDEEAEDYIRTVRQFCILSYELYIKDKNKSSDS